MYERGVEIAQAVAEFIRERGYFNGLDDNEFDEALNGFMDSIEVEQFADA